MATRKRAARRELSPAQRRRQIIEILSSALANMPLATTVPGKPTAEHATKKLSEKPPAGLEVSGD